MLSAFFGKDFFLNYYFLFINEPEKSNPPRIPSRINITCSPILLLDSGAVLRKKVLKPINALLPGTRIIIPGTRKTS